MSDDTTPPPASLTPPSDIKPPAGGRVAAVVDAWNAKRSEFVVNRHIGNHPSHVSRKDTDEVVFGPDTDDACWRFLDEQCAAAVLTSLPPVRATVSGLRLAAAKDFVGADPTLASATDSEAGAEAASARAEITRMAQQLGCDDKPTIVFREALRLAKRNVDGSVTLPSFTPELTVGRASEVPVDLDDAEPRLTDHERSMLITMFEQRASQAVADRRLIDAETFRMGVDALTASPSEPQEVEAQRAEACEQIATDVLGWLSERGLYDPRDYEIEGPDVAQILSEHEEDLLQPKDPRSAEEVLRDLTEANVDRSGAADVPVTIKVAGIRPLDWRASKHDMHYADPDTAFCGYVIAQTEGRVTWRPSDSDEWRPADDLAHAKSAVQADFLQRLSKFVSLAAAGVSGAPGSWDSLSLLQQAVVSAWNYMQSPTSYSESEKGFVFELLDAAHKDVYGRDHVTVDVPSSAVIEGIARPIYEEMGYHFDGRTILADGKPYGDWALAIRCAERVLGHIASPPAPAADATEPAIADDIRALGWAVAVHNDYRLRGEAHTFWLFTKDGRAIKGEGLSDAAALNQVRAEISGISGKGQDHV